MVDSFNRQVLRLAVAQICQSMGWDALHKSTHDTLTDVMQRYLEEIGKVANNYTQLCNRTKPNLDDLHLAFQDTGVVLQELENFVAQVDPLQFIHPFTAYPKCQPCRLQHPSKGDIVDRAEFYSEHLPPLPKICQEPTGEKEENPTAENNSVTSAEEVEKIKSTPLKESSNVMDTSENVAAVKRRHEIGVLFPRDNKRSRLDIPANLIIEKKENVENTDGESLSPATPVSPYLPQDLPKLTEEPAKPPSVVKVKTEPKQLPNLAKEMVLPLQKITQPLEKKIKSETSSSPKKLKVKKEKSISPNVQNKPTLSSPKTEVSSPMKSPPSVKNSPSAKMKSPIKSPLAEKQVIKKTNKGGEHKSSFLGSKGSPSSEILSKAVSAKKSPSVVEAKKELASPKIKDREFNTVKKKKKTSVETDSGKSSRDTERTKSVSSASTPKLMIKLPKSEQHSESSPKYSPVKPKISAAPVKAKTPGSPSATKAIGLKSKTFESESSAKSEKKHKISGDSLEFAILKKEHSKKKKKKKDKDREREKSVHKEKRKSEKIEPPIPKIRFKLDPSGESKTKTGESTTSSSKRQIQDAVRSTGQSSSKKSSTVVIETENVRSSVFIQTLSNSTLEYDPDRAYYCPVCHKQDDGSPMVGCDGCDEWCHWSCVGLMAAPPKHEKWYCPLCLQKKTKKKKAKSRKKS